MSDFEVISTTADVGIRFRGNSYHGFFENAAKGLNLLYFDTDLPSAAQTPATVYSFIYHGDSIENVLVNFLAEAVYLVQIRELALTGILLQDAGDTFIDVQFLTHPLHCKPDIEIKSVTYHNLEVKRIGDTLSTVVIFDI